MTALAQAEVISCFSVHDPEGLDAEHRDGPTDVTDPDEDDVARAEARAEAARARLQKLREATETGDADDPDNAVDDRQPAKSPRKRLRLPKRPGRPRKPGWLRRPGRRTIAVSMGIVIVSASCGATGYMLWQHRTAVHNRQLAAEFSAAARQGVTALMSIDPAHARDDVQRMIDSSTGEQKNSLSVLSALIVKKAEETKVGMKVTVEAVAVESVGDNSGVVLVAAKTDATGPDNGKPPPALFRLAVTLDRDGGQLKMSKIDFLQ